MLESARSGLSAGSDAWTEKPMLVVDLDSEGDSHRLRVPDGLPCLVVGVGSARSRGSAGARYLDLSVSEEPVPSREWIRSQSVEGELNALAATLDQRTRAAVTFAQVLRIGAGLSLERALLVESLAYSTLQSGPEFAAWLAQRPVRRSARLESEPVIVERSGSRLTLTLNRPHVHNAYSAAVRDGLCEALAIAHVDDTVTEIVLRGVGPSFCSGGDLAEFGTLSDPSSAHLIRSYQSPARLIHQLSGKVVALLHGWCVGSGAELPSFAGRVVADPETRFRLPELAMGLIPGAGGTAGLPARIGRYRTAWLGLTGSVIDAELALEWGLIDSVVGDHGDDCSVQSGG